MAERAMHENAFLFALTYADDTQFQRDGAAMFRYSDVRAMLNSLRQQIYRETGSREAIRFICAGEQGERDGRCHWHIILYSDLDLLGLGTWRAPWGFVTDRDQKLTIGKREKRRNWSFWPHGFVTVQEPNAGGMRYAISYALKDQFTGEKSKGTMREAKVETYATGLFRMSKTPPIGAEWLDGVLAELSHKGAVLPRLQLRVPNVRSYWCPTGTMRKRLLSGLRAINEEHAARTGRNAPQWSSLLASCADNETDLEGLLGVAEIEDEENEDLASRLAAGGRAITAKAKADNVARRCGGQVACNACLRGLGPETLEALGIEEYRSAANGKYYFRFRGAENEKTLRAARNQGRVGAINPYCGLKGTTYVTKYFPQSAGRASTFGK